MLCLPPRYLLAAVSFGVLASSAVAAPSAPGNVTAARVAADSSGDNWLVKGGSFAQQQFSPLRAINDKNVARLGLAWIAEMDDPMGLAAEPLVVDGVIYVSAPRSIVRAVNAADGKILWTFDPHVRLDYSTVDSSIARVNRGVAVWEGKVYVGTADGRLMAIDAAKGTQLWSVAMDDPAHEGISGAPRVAAGKVFIGHTGSDDQVRGSISAYDANSGKRVWQLTVPGDPALGFESKTIEMAAKTWSGKEWWKQGGGAVWDPITYDAKTGLLLFGTSKAFAAVPMMRRQRAAARSCFPAASWRCTPIRASMRGTIRPARPSGRPRTFIRAGRRADRRPGPPRRHECGAQRHVLRAGCRNRRVDQSDAVGQAGVVGCEDGLPRRGGQRGGGLQGELLRGPQLVADEL